MEHRLTLIDKNLLPQYVQSSPLLLEANALYFDNVDSQFIAQLKLKNIHKKTINAVIVELICFNPFGHEIKRCSYEYDQLSVCKGQIFGVKTAISLGEEKVSRYVVCLKAVAFEDGSVLEFDVPLTYCPLPDSKKQELQGELLEQYKRDLAKKHFKISVIYQPQVAEGLWQCVCGSWQMEEDNCIMCYATHEELNLAASPTLLENNLIAFREQQEASRKDKIYTDAKQKMNWHTVKDFTEAIKLFEAIRGWKDTDELISQCDQSIRDINQKIITEQKEQARKKRKKAFTRILIACISIVAFFFVIKFVIPNQKYDAAMGLMKAGEYEKAISTFEEIESYKDSAQQIKICTAALLNQKYVAAMALMKEGKYEKAIAAFTDIKHYKDSSDQIKQCEKNIAYLENFTVTAGMYVWDTKKDENVEFLFAKDSYSLNDYAENQALYPVLRVVNESASMQTVDISAVYDGKNWTWVKTDVGASKTHNFYGVSSTTGTHTIVWYINGIVAATTKYTISD